MHTWEDGRMDGRKKVREEGRKDRFVKGGKEGMKYGWMDRPID